MKLLLLMLLGVVTGCSVIKPTGPYDLRSEKKTVLKKERENERTDFTEGPLTLQRAIKIALENNPGLGVLSWEKAAAEARKDKAFGAFWPCLDMVGAHTRSLNRQRLIPASKGGDYGVFSRDISSGEIVLSLPVFTGGRLINQMKAKELLYLAASRRLAYGRDELVFNVSSIFYSIIAMEHTIGSLNFSKDVLEKHGNKIDALINERKAAKVDRSRLDVRMANIEEKIIKEENLKSIQIRALANLMGIEKERVSIKFQGNLESKMSYQAPELEEALMAAWKNRDDYKAAQASFQAREKIARAAKSNHWPSLYLQGAYGRRWATGEVIGEGDKQKEVGRVGLTLKIPVFEGGRIKASVREELANLAAEGERLRALEFQIRLQVETALLNLKSTRERAFATRKSIDLAKENFRIAREKYNLRKGSVLNVLDAQAALLEMETAYYRILAEYHGAIFQLKLAMGEE